MCSWNGTLRFESRRNCRPDAFQTRQQIRCVTYPKLSTSEVLGYNLSQTLARAVLCCSIPSLETFGRMAVLVLPPACSFPPADDLRCAALCVTDRSLSFAAAVLSYVQQRERERERERISKSEWASGKLCCLECSRTAPHRDR